MRIWIFVSVVPVNLVPVLSPPIPDSSQLPLVSSDYLHVFQSHLCSLLPVRSLSCVISCVSQFSLVPVCLGS